MVLRTENLRIFPDITKGMTLDDIRFYLISLFGDGIVSGFEANLEGGAIALSPGIAIIDGVVIMHTQPITLPYSTVFDKDVMLVNQFSNTRVQIPEIIENYTGSKPYIILYSINAGSINYLKTRYSLAAKSIKSFGFTWPVDYYNGVVSGGAGDPYHKHMGLYRLQTVVHDNISDNSIIKPPTNVVGSFIHIKSLDVVADSSVRCFIDGSYRVRVYCEKSGAVVSRGTATLTFLCAVYGSSGEQIL